MKKKLRSNKSNDPKRTIKDIFSQYFNGKKSFPKVSDFNAEHGTFNARIEQKYLYFKKVLNAYN